LNTVKVYGDDPIDPNAIYTFSVNNGESITLITGGDQAQITWDIVGTFTLTITKILNGCTTSATTTVIVTTSPSGTVDPQSVCEGGSPITLTGTNLGNSVTWSGTGVVGNTFDPAGLSAGTYTVTTTGTDANGCTIVSTGTITVTPLPTIIFNSN
jgi:hypothetical protein